MILDKKNERILTLIGILGLLIFSAIGFFIYYSKQPFVYSEFIDLLIGSFFINVVATYFIFIGNFRIDRFLQKYYPWDKIILVRVFLEYILIIVYSMAVMLITGLLLKLILNLDYPDYIQNLMKQTFFIILIITTFVIFYSFVIGWKRAKIDIQRLEKETANARFESLKANIKPHFLFNSLNTLSSLIKINPDLAEEYTEGLSDIYRYILKSNDELLVTVEEEISFVKTYLKLQKIRYGESFVFTVDVEKLKDKLIPALTIQLLVENAIKHNIINEEHKLNININIDHHKIIVTNNISRKIKNTKSTGFGIKNIIGRYSYFTEQVPEFIKTDKEYIARIPVIQK